jgi:hypothetical protein
VWSGPVIVATVVGALGLFVAGLSLGWQVLAALRDRRTFLRIRLARSTFWTPQGVGLNDELLVITAVNESSHAVRVTKVAIEYDLHGAPGISASWWEPFPGATIPGLLDARDTGITTQVYRVGGHYVGFVPSTEPRLRAVAYTVDTLEFRSPWVRYDKVPWASHLAQIPVSEDARRTLETSPQLQGAAPELPGPQRRDEDAP